MKYQNRALVEELAAQYAIGTMRGSARRRFEQLCERDGYTRLALQRWEDRLVDLVSAVRPVQPSPEVWRGIESRIRAKSAEDQGSDVSWWNSHRWALAAAFVLLVATTMLWTMFSAPSTYLVATITDQQQTQLWRIEATRDRDTLRVEIAESWRADRTRAYELWALSASGGAPVSLGVMPQTGALELQLDETQRSALAAARQVAISLEPLGGSQTGAPTGPVLFVAAIASG